ncbi:MAG: YIP1 family protein [Acidobacteriota bacterium]
MDENESPELQPTPVKHVPVEEAPQMSEASMVGNIFIEPGRVFEDQRRKPRFIIGGLIMLIAISIFQVMFVEKYGLEKIVKARIESSKRTADLPDDQKATIIQQQSGPVAKYITYAATPLVIAIMFLLGGLIYWLGANAMGGTGKFFGGVAVWVYSSLPPALVFTAANIIVMMLKDPETIDLATAQRGLVKANLGFFIDEKTMPVIGAILSSIDLFAIWGWVLAAIGLQKVAKISSGAAWAVVIILGLVGVGAKVVGAMFF